MGRSKSRDSVVQSDLRGRTTVVTGGSSGIGFEVARALALAGARVLLLSCNSQEGEDAIRAIQKLKTNGPIADITFIECHLGDLAHVKKIADRISKEEKRLDILVCDTAINIEHLGMSTDGIDSHFAVNYLCYFLLINRLLPLLRYTSKLPHVPPPRIVSVSSELHRSTSSKTTFGSAAELNGSSVSETDLLARSKLAIILFTKYGLVDRVIRPTGARIYALATDPGQMKTGQEEQLAEHGTIFGTLRKYTVKPFMHSADQGSLSTLWAATSPEVEKHSWQGRYFVNPGQLGDESEMACNEELGERLWHLSEGLVRDKLGVDALLPWDEGEVSTI